MAYSSFLAVKTSHAREGTSPAAHGEKASGLPERRPRRWEGIIVGISSEKMSMPRLDPWGHNGGGCGRMMAGARARGYSGRRWLPIEGDDSGSLALEEIRIEGERAEDNVGGPQPDAVVSFQS
jgi:hypothetical protein